jgi:DNA-binding LytR/AlgR family response regulator
LLLDDELPALNYLRLMCSELPEVEVVKAFNDPQRFLLEVQQLPFDLVIMDIQMPNISGLEVAAALKGKAVIFISAHKHYAAEAFDLDVIDFISKPIQKERLLKAIQKVIRFLDTTEQNKTLSLNTDKGKGLITIQQIIRITNSESDKRDKLVFLADGTNVVAKNITFDALLEKLPDDRFCRISKKDVIALSVVRFYSASDVIIQVANKEIRIPMSENFRKSFLDKQGRGLIT